MKKVSALFLTMVLSIFLASNCFAKEVESEKVYYPVDLVVVVDSSGSMQYSDPNRTALEAVKILVDMMPANDSRVGIVSFNTEATVLTKNPSGEDSLVSLAEFTGVETIRTDVSNISYSGGTGIGNALHAATELLDKCSDNNHTKAIILFTDGINEFGYNKVALASCEENEVDALKWAKANNCCIYCVGYDYPTSSGVSSMGANGEGLQKLQNISSSTKGEFKAIHNIADIQQLLINFLAEVFDLIYKPMCTLPGDGGFHECTIHVDPSVVEANIRIAGGTANSIKSGKIRLYDPSGKEIKLENSGNIRFFVDATAASIKVIMPKTGDWRLTVDGIYGDDILIGLLEHYKMNLTSQLIFPDGNPEGVAYTNDVIGIKTWLTYDDAALENDEIYEAVTSATAVCVSRANPDDVKTIELNRDGRSFIGSFIIPEDCYYDVTIRLNWDTVYRQDTLTVMSSNTPLELVKDIGDIKVNKGKTITVDNIYQYVRDVENDPIEVSLKSVTTTGVADFNFIGDKLDITGVKGWWANTLVTVEYKDAQGNSVETSFKVSVGDPVLVAALIIIGILLLIAAILILRYIKRMFNVVPGYIKVKYIADGFLNGNSFVMSKLIYQNPSAAGEEINNIEKSQDFYGGTTDGGIFGGSAFDGDFNPDIFNTQQDQPGTDFDDIFGNTSPFGEANSAQEPDYSNPFDDQAAADSHDAKPSPNELMKSDLFNQSVQLSQAGTKKAVLSKALEYFVKKYTDAMNEGNTDGRSSVLAESVNKYINDYFIHYLARFVFIGTPFGKNGAYLKANLHDTRKTLVVHSPTLSKKKTHLVINKNNVVLSFSVKEDKKDNEGRTPCHHIEIVYSKYE